MTGQELRLNIRESGAHNRCDLSRLFVDREAFAAAVRVLCDPFRSHHVSIVAGIDSMGLTLAGAIARELMSGVAMLRKPGKVAWDTRCAAFRDYKGEEAHLEVASDTFSAADRVLIVDDWSETGAQLEAAVRLVEGAGAIVAGLAVLNADPQARARFAKTPHRIHSAFVYSL